MFAVLSGLRIWLLDPLARWETTVPRDVLSEIWRNQRHELDNHPKHIEADTNWLELCKLRFQAIIWTKDGPIYRGIYTSLGLCESIILVCFIWLWNTRPIRQIHTMRLYLRHTGNFMVQYDHIDLVSNWYFPPFQLSVIQFALSRHPLQCRLKPNYVS